MTTLPSSERIFLAMDATWEPAEMRRMGPWMLRRDNGGGKRVTATSAVDTVSEADIISAEKAMARMGQARLFMVRGGETELDGILAGLGYEIVDPVLTYAAPTETIATYEPDRLAAIPCEEPLAIMEEIWAEGGIGPGRLSVMKRTKGPKTYLFSRLILEDYNGCLFLACDGDVAMFHALQVAPTARRIGVARHLIVKAAIWAAENGAKSLATVTTGENLPAQKLFTSLGMEGVGSYHYRMKLRG